LRGHGRRILGPCRVFINAVCAPDPWGGQYAGQLLSSEVYLILSPIIAHLSAGHGLRSVPTAQAKGRSSGLQQNPVRPTTDLRAAENLWPQGLRAKTGNQGHEAL